MSKDDKITCMRLFFSVALKKGVFSKSSTVDFSWQVHLLQFSLAPMESVV